LRLQSSTFAIDNKKIDKMSRSNNDFRAMLAAKSAPLSIPATTVVSTSASSEQKAQLKESRRLHFANKRRHQDGKNNTNNDDNNVDNDDSTQKKYRDRAAERRQGKVIDGVDEAARVDASKFTEDESKHLGGDVEHTHLVKGLDFTLLARVRAEQELQKQTEFSNVVDSTVASTSSIAAPTRRRASGKTSTTTTSDAVSARTALGKSVLKALFGEPVAQNPRMFPGHMYYSFDLSPKIPPLPKSVVRAKADVPVLAYSMSSVEKLVLARVSRAVAESRDPSIRARKAAEAAARDAAEKAAEAAALAAARRAVEEADEDIFADAGTYVTAIVSEDVTATQAPVGAALFFEQELLAAQQADEDLAAENAAFFEEMEDDYQNTNITNREDDDDEDDDAEDDAYPVADRTYRDDSDGSEPMDDVEVDDDADERARKLLVARGLAVAEDEYGAIGMSNSTLPSVFGDDDDDGDGEKGNKKSSEKQDQKQKASKFDRDLRTVSGMVDKKAADRGAKRLIGEHTGASEKKRNRK
jgi:hypothetical protein